MLNDTYGTKPGICRPWRGLIPLSAWPTHGSRRGPKVSHPLRGLKTSETGQVIGTTFGNNGLLPSVTHKNVGKIFIESS